MQQRMKIALAFVVTLASALGIGANVAVAQGPKESPKAVTATLGNGFTYQGQLKKNGNPVTATCTFTFTLWDSSTGGTQIGSPQTQSLGVANGVFTSKPIDFGTGAFQGDARYLQIAVLCPGDATATTLSRQAVTPTPYALALPGLYTQQNATSPNLVGGYSGNTVNSGVYGATIGGGGESGYPNRVWDSFDTIGGGEGNGAQGLDTTIGGGKSNNAIMGAAVIGGGHANTASNWYATVGGGESNTASGQWSIVGGGNGNTASAQTATIGGGSNNNANGDGATVGGGGSNDASGIHATIPGGFFASASHYGEMAYASGRFDNTGDAQTSLYVLLSETTDATQTELFLDGIGQRITVVPNSLNGALSFEILVTALSSTGQSAGYRMWGVIKGVGGGTTMVGTSSQVLGEDDASWDAVAVAGNGALEVKVTGAAGKIIRWVATVRTTQVGY